jgi:hypothetical protein
MGKIAQKEVRRTLLEISSQRLGSRFRQPPFRAVAADQIIRLQGWAGLAA